jgi:hypothetical protein
MKVSRVDLDVLCEFFYLLGFKYFLIPPNYFNLRVQKLGRSRDGNRSDIENIRSQLYPRLQLIFAL